MASLPPDNRAAGTPDPANDMNAVVDCLSTITGAAPGTTVTAQGTLNTLAGAATSGQVLRGNGTNVVLAAIAAGDVPTLNQNTTGTAANVTGTVAIGHGGTGQTTAGAALTALGGLTLQAATSLSGYTLVNGTGTIVSWSVPNDGAMHQFMCVAVQRVTSAETGGSIQVAWNIPDGTSTTTSVFGGGGGTGISSFSQQKLVQPGSTVTVQQNTALTSGASVAWVQLWGL